ncbi:MAG TPA: ribonuclease H-like domain-containing protein, partial [Dehalococcoidia bacterium]|nr:ribonuclease H-like domain-containing protein [Dehalococcoidia bacterium]
QWWQYRKANDAGALKTLLDYNREDLVNLKSLRRVLAGRGTH